MRYLLTILTALLVMPSCNTLDDDRIPVAPVLIQFQSVAVWDAYGVPGAMSYRYFIKSEKQPANYPYTALSATGFGGVLLCGDINGQPVAYDLACPVECKQSVRVRIDDDALVAECPVCHSTYDVFTLSGHPLSGPASKEGYGLRRYRVGPGTQGEYRMVSY